MIHKNGLLLRGIQNPSRETVLCATNQNAYAIKYAPEFHNDKEIMMSVITRNNDLIRFIGADLSRDYDIANTAREHKSLILYIAWPLRMHKQFILQCKNFLISCAEDLSDDEACSMTGILPALITQGYDVQDVIDQCYITKHFHIGF